MVSSGDPCRPVHDGIALCLVAVVYKPALDGFVRDKIRDADAAILPGQLGKSVGGLSSGAM